MRDHLLALHHIRIALHGQTLLSLNETVEPGEVLTVMGPSGSGKSTLLAYIAGFLDSAFEASGDVILDEEIINNLPAQQRHIGLLFQDAMLFPHLSVAGNLGFGLPQDMPDRQKRTEEALADIGLAGFGSRDPDTLSGGQKSRVALMRLLLSQPHAVLLDEPFSRLDANLRGEMRSLVFNRLRDAGLPSLLVTHDEQDAEAAGGKVIELKD
jgi:putative thiamine transport system ATP-binding protein